MRVLVIILLFFFSLSRKEKEEKYNSKNVILKLTDDTLEKVIKENEYILILFVQFRKKIYNRIIHEFEEVANELKKDKLVFGTMDIFTQKKSLEKYEINTIYPTILFFNHGEPVVCQEIAKAEIINWINNHFHPATKLLSTIEEVEKFLKENPVCTIYFGTNQKEIKDFERIALNIEDFPFGRVQTKEIIEKYSRYGTAILYKNFDEKKNEITNIDSEKLKEFYNLYSMPRVLELNNYGVSILYKTKKPGLILFERENSKNWEEYDKLLHNLYDKLNNTIKLIFTGAKEEESKTLATYFGVKRYDFPFVMIVDTRENQLKKYKMKDIISEDNILKFINDFKENKLRQYYLSEKIPEINDGNVFILVGDNYEEKVLNNTKDIMILFYAPFCRESRLFQPIYEEIAKELKPNNPNLILAKIDFTENEVEGISFSGYPAIKFYPGNKKDKKPINYQGNRNFAEIIDFIKNNAATPINYNKISDL